MKHPVCYTPEQQEQIQNVIDDIYGGDECGMIAHEITSEYVHTDTRIIAPEGDKRTFVTFGMSARAMDAPHPDLEHVELLMCASEALEPNSKEAMVLISEMVRLSKYPFRNQTWLGHGHTIDASGDFKETFGFDAFALICDEAIEIDGIGKVEFLLAVPIYEQEREWIMETDTFGGYLLLNRVFGQQLHYADIRREKYIPDEKTKVVEALKDYLEWVRQHP